MEYFQVSYYSRVVIYDCRAFIRLVTGLQFDRLGFSSFSTNKGQHIFLFETVQSSQTGDQGPFP